MTAKRTKPELDIELAILINDVKYIKDEISAIRQKMEADYVTRTEFEPIRKIVYGMVSLILVAVVGALISLVVMK